MTKENSKPTKSNFDLKKVKFDGKKVLVEYDYSHKRQDFNEKWTNGTKIPCVPHPDLIALFNQLREYVLKEFYVEPTVDNLSLVDITTVSLDDRKCVISANFNTLHGGIVNVNTSKIDLDYSETGLEAEIDAIVDAMIDEVFKLLFENKRADPTLFATEPEIGLNNSGSNLMKAV
ncbi:hypothetical protein [Flavobacterium phage FCOV-F18]|uniref:Uncharacterized protein n=10 Tax=Ficleduovirus FCV1 TaxID=2560474 RepID=F6IQ85_9CAUD|nr:hypothetical protein FDG55_gp62 [Flavobacterium phage FCV-1]ASD51644.1 hypothetical protein [Flavobacterium phage FCV-3]ASD51718.1 hypothetical protein [Flavobacterium phage FCV-11]ASD51792.1 hypothetical protein [Flavobacterium phage V175]ASD51870.1 hypothetical protein [Flavobacterium phage V181]ASD52548.1 hypothetical protein [Flavobacterium phage FCV-10]ASD52621.1 hypothetical protein [Flavobacterium phage FCV-16]ASD52695.1 hypothetical protein [Flavobacterium phage FCV-20]ASD52925.1